MNDYLYPYRGKEILVLLDNKIKIINSVIKEKKSKIDVSDGIKHPYVGDIDNIFDPIKMNSKKNEISELEKELKTCTVMRDEMVRNRWKKYMLTLQDLVLLKYVGDVKV